MELKFSGFDWDVGNRDKSLKKHGVTCQEAELVFYNQPFVYPDLKHSTEFEKRYVLFGETENKKLFISFTLRGHELRIISARPMSTKERSWYEEQKKQTPV